MPFSDRLRELRINSGYTQKELAQKCQIAQSCIAMLEKGRSEASVSTLITLSNEFDVSIEYLLGLEDEFGERTAKKMLPALNAEEQKIIEDYRALPAPGKQLVKTTIKTFKETYENERRRAKNSPRTGS